MFLVVLHRSGPQWDPSRPLEEQPDWPAHASFMDGLVDAGFVASAGRSPTSTAWCTSSKRSRRTPSAPPSRAIRGARRISGSTRSIPGRSGSTRGAPNRGSFSRGRWSRPSPTPCSRSCGDASRNPPVRVSRRRSHPGRVAGGSCDDPRSACAHGCAGRAHVALTADTCGEVEQRAGRLPETSGMSLEDEPLRAPSRRRSCRRAARPDRGRSRG